MAARLLTQVDVGSEAAVRPVEVRSLAHDRLNRETIRIGKLNDARLLAIARGEHLPEEDFRPLVLEDPFLSLVNGDEVELNLGGWLPGSPENAAALQLSVEKTAVPQLIMTPEELAELPLEHGVGFLLTHIDGLRTVEQILDVSLLSAEDTLRAMSVLIEIGAITLG